MGTTKRPPPATLLLIDQAFAAGNAMVNGLDVRHRVDLIVLLAYKGDRAKAEGFMIDAFEAHLRPAVVRLDKSKGVKFWPEGIPVYALWRADEDERRKIEASVERFVPKHYDTLWAYEPGEPRRPLGFSAKRD